ncbi:MAG: hypothetical protein IT159_06260 [Bryobacterales bacterium]|nr:hypothetical protein [Bryobacterales bacterium]
MDFCPAAGPACCFSKVCWTAPGSAVMAEMAGSHVLHGTAGNLELRF